PSLVVSLSGVPSSSRTTDSRMPTLIDAYCSTVMAVSLRVLSTSLTASPITVKNNSTSTSTTTIATTTTPPRTKNTLRSECVEAGGSCGAGSVPSARGPKPGIDAFAVRPDASSTASESDIARLSIGGIEGLRRWNGCTAQDTRTTADALPVTTTSSPHPATLSGRSSGARTVTRTSAPSWTTCHRNP